VYNVHVIIVLKITEFTDKYLTIYTSEKAFGCFTEIARPDQTRQLDIKAPDKKEILQTFQGVISIQ